MKEFISSILGDKRKLGIAAIVIIAGVLVLTVFVAQKQQEIRQRAEGEQTAFFFAKGDQCSAPATTAFIGSNTTITLSLCLNTNNTGVNLVNGFDVTIAKGDGVTFTGISDGADGVKLTTPYFNTIKGDGTIRFGRIDNTGVTITGTALNLGTITLTTANTGTGNISITNAQVISPTSPTSALSVVQPILPYTISATAPTPTTTSISTLGPCYPLGDVNVDGSVDSVDALLILRFVAALPITGTFNHQNADVDRDGQITSVDALKIQRYIAGLDPSFPGCGIAIPTPTPTTAPTAIPTLTPTNVPTAVPTPTTVSLQGPCYPLGDVNVDGSVDSVDALLILRYVAALPITGTFNQQNADVDGVDGITSVDALKIQRYIAGFDPSFAGCTTAIATPTPTTTSFSPADIDRDGDIDLIDFGYWLKAFQEGGNPPFLKADGNPYFPDVHVDPAQPANTIDLLDFGAWLNAYQAQANP